MTAIVVCASDAASGPGAPAATDPALQALYLAHVTAIAARTASALEQAGYDGVVIPAGEPPLLWSDDQNYPFKANPQFRLWVPEAEPGCCVLFEPGRQPVLVFHQPEDYWHQPPALPSGWWADAFDLRVIRHAEDVREHVTPGKRWALLGEPQGTTAGLGDPNPPALAHRLDWCRAAKTPYEIECLRRANRTGARAHRAAERAFRAGASEFEAQFEYCSAAGAREEELPYNNIVAFGRHGAVLHYQHLARTREAGAPSFLIDAGASFKGYGSDITRTWSRADDGFAALVAAMDVEQRALAALVRPGTDYATIHLEAHRRIAGVLERFGLVTVSAEAAVATGVTRVFFPHGIGHLLGLQVHDVGGLQAAPEGGVRARPDGHPYLRLTRTLEPGFVVTIEPGLYFIDPLLDAARASPNAAAIAWQRVDEFHRHGGVRIEDDVVALPEGPENLTRDAFGSPGG